jgi:hypothetical protein
VRVYDDGVSRGTAGSVSEREEEKRHREHQPGAAPDVSDDPVAVRQPVVAKRRGRDDLDLEPRRAKVLDRVTNEDTRDFIGPARVGRREDDDFHSRRGRPKTTGSAAASVAKT